MDKLLFRYAEDMFRRVEANRIGHSFRAEDIAGLNCKSFVSRGDSLFSTVKIQNARSQEKTTVLRTILSEETKARLM